MTFQLARRFNAGTLQIGGGGVLGGGNYSAGISIGNSGALAMSASSSQTFSGAISNSGALTLNGSGNVLFSNSISTGGVLPQASGQAGDGSDGVICQRLNAAGHAACVTSANLTDGASNTILVGEKRLNPSFCTTQCQPNDNAGYVGGFQDDSSCWGGYGVMQSNGAVSSGFLFWPPVMDRTAPLDTMDSLADGHNFWFGSSHAGAPSSCFATARSR